MFDEQYDDDDVIEQEESETVESDAETNEKSEEQNEEESYSKRVQKRIDNLVKQRNIERQEREKTAQEVRQLREELEKLKTGSTNQSLDDERAKLLTAKKEAYDIGDVDRIVEIDEKLFDLKLQAMQKPDAKPEPQQQPAVTSNAALAEWEEANPWVYDGKNKQKVNQAQAILDGLINNGYAADDPETYYKLDELLNRQPAPPATGAPDRGRVSGASSNRGFTASDRETMERLNLDPNNPVHRKEFLKNKAS